jgi:hypothetical protein
MRANDRNRAWIVVVLLFIFMVINFMVINFVWALTQFRMLGTGRVRDGRCLPRRSRGWRGTGLSGGAALGLQMVPR